MVERKSMMLFALFLMYFCVQQCEAQGIPYAYSGYLKDSKNTEDLQVNDENILKNEEISRNIFEDDMDTSDNVNEFLSYLEES